MADRRINYWRQDNSLIACQQWRISHFMCHSNHCLLADSDSVSVMFDDWMDKMTMFVWDDVTPLTQTQHSSTDHEREQPYIGIGGYVLSTNFGQDNLSLTKLSWSFWVSCWENGHFYVEIHNFSTETLNIFSCRRSVPTCKETQSSLGSSAMQSADQPVITFDVCKYPSMFQARQASRCCCAPSPPFCCIYRIIRLH